MAAFYQDDYFADRYKLIELIREEEFSELWNAEDKLAGNTPVLIKVGKAAEAEDAETDPLDTEAFSVLSIKHKNFVNVSHVDVYKGFPFLVIPRFAQGSLSTLLQEQKSFTEFELAKIIRDIGSALSFLHGQAPPVLYKEVKPENILIGDDGGYLLADPKMSSEASDQSSASYTAPELFSFKPFSNEASDIFSFGVVLYQLCTGALPWSGNGGVSLLEGKEVPNLPKNYSNSLNTIVRACLSPLPLNRPTAKQLLQVADFYLKNEVWKPGQKAQKKEKVKKVIAPQPAQRSAGKKQTNVVKPVLLVLSVLVILLTAAVIYFNAFEQSESQRLSATDTESMLTANVIEEEKFAGASDKRADIPAKAAEPVKKAVAVAEPPKKTAANTEEVKSVPDKFPLSANKYSSISAEKPAAHKEEVAKSGRSKPGNLAEYLNYLSDTSIPRKEREKWRGEITNYFSDKDHLIIDGKAGIIADTYTINELVSFLMTTRETKVVINHQRKDQQGKVAELHVEIIPKNPTQ
jgi:serine/threonine protein kinase